MDTKSTGILGVCIIIAALIIGTFLRHQASPVPTETHVGRFQMGSVTGHAYVIDTTTGQVWEEFSMPNGGSSDAEFKKPKIK
jgi:hypothetical protein